MKYVLMSAVLLIFGSTIYAQNKNRNPKKINPAGPAMTKQVVAQSKIKLGEKEVFVKGQIFNEIVYNTGLSYQKNKYISYQYTDASKKAIIITEVYYEIINDNAEARTVTTYTLPLDKINKKESYLLEMQDDYLPAKTYQRLTILNTGINQQNFSESRLSIGDEKPEVKKVNNVTVNMESKTEAEKVLKEITK